MGRQRHGEAVSYLHRGEDFPCLAECPEVLRLPRLSVAEFLGGQGAGPGEARGIRVHAERLPCNDHLKVDAAPRKHLPMAERGSAVLDLFQRAHAPASIDLSALNERLGAPSRGMEIDEAYLRRFLERVAGTSP